MNSLTVLRSGIWVVCAVIAGTVGAFAAETLQLDVRSEPTMEAIKPNVDAAKLIFQIEPKDGRSVGAVKYHIELYSPPKNAMFSTGFPIAEGTQLLSGDFTTENGKLELNYLFPIRGAYRLIATAETAGGSGTAGVRTERDMILQIREEPDVVRNFSVLMALLAVFGAVSGVVLGRSAVRRAVASGAVAAVLLMSLATGSACAHDAHPQPERDVKTTDKFIAVTSSGDRIELHLTPEFATVGHMATLEGAFTQKDKAAGPVVFSLAFVNLDHNKEIFRTQFQTPDGTFRLQHQFTDGAAHRIELTALPASALAAAPMVAEMNIAVHAINPPQIIVFRTLAFMLGVIAVFMGLAFFATVKLSRV